MTAIKERPILFSAPMVRAILDGRKTVTRRPVRGFQIPTEDTSIPEGERHRWSATAQRDPRYGFCVFGATEAECAKELEEFAPCPYGRPGERLWVRETWTADAQVDAVAPRDLSQGEPILYSADGAIRQTGCSMMARGRGRPSIHMPRWASRILLEITDVRVERLQDISEEQAIDEGLSWEGEINGKTFYTHAPKTYPPGSHQQFGVSGTDAISAFRNLWKSTGGDWDANPWVWVVEFKRVQP
ncbi:hypothetical protein C1893_01965 [Pseudomonas sp. MPR-ANC1]|uniref:hypothetical protein n=1 Tax=Pseudomonas sp. MPR-ANC1 TaxID=2075548 RepID=UPI000CD016BB|nr:hypothetical protein [Pseudomonas sp. MPR-ANC1]POA50342.1 hypothetical protein C1893_01965 [Pseudomonas sp. MPR-ANC1]